MAKVLITTVYLASGTLYPGTQIDASQEATVIAAGGILGDTSNNAVAAAATQCQALLAGGRTSPEQLQGIMSAAYAGNTPGATGPAGPAGATGASGPQGPAGATGASGPLKFNKTTTKTTDYTAAYGELVPYNPSGGAFPINLPAASGHAGEAIAVKNTTNSATQVTVTANGLDMIDGSSTFAMAAGWKGAIFISDGSAGWMVFGTVN